MGQHIHDIDTSVITSLDELMSIDKERVASERTAQEKRIAVAERQRVEAEAKAKAAEAASLATKEARRLEAKRSHEEHLARIEAIKAAELARSNAEIGRRSINEKMSMMERHVHELEEARNQEHRRDRRFTVGALLAVLAVGGAFGGYAVNDHVTGLQRQIDGLTTKVADTNAERDGKVRELNSANERIGSLDKRIASLEKQLARRAAAKPGAATPKVRRPTHRYRPPTTPTPAEVKPLVPCRTGDPSCATDIADP